MERVRKHLCDNGGNLDTEHLVVIVIAFVVGAILVAGVISALNSGYDNGLSNRVHEWLK